MKIAAARVVCLPKFREHPLLLLPVLADRLAFLAPVLADRPTGTLPHPQVVSCRMSTLRACQVPIGVGWLCSESGHVAWRMAGRSATRVPSFP